MGVIRVGRTCTKKERVPKRTCAEKSEFVPKMTFTTANLYQKKTNLNQKKRICTKNEPVPKKRTCTKNKRTCTKKTNLYQKQTKLFDKRSKHAIIIYIQ